jgi:cation transport ATPase
MHDIVSGIIGISDILSKEVIHEAVYHNDEGVEKFVMVTRDDNGAVSTTIAEAVGLNVYYATCTRGLG